jgi:hypothetical protein
VRETDSIAQHGVKTLPFYPLEINIELTSKGLHAAPGLGMGVVQCVFDYIAMLRSHGPQKWFWLEKKAINDLNFQCAPHPLTCAIKAVPVAYVHDAVLGCIKHLTLFKACTPLNPVPD